MDCPRCTNRTRVYKTRQRHAITYRWRLCTFCKMRFRTRAEEIVLEHLPVIPAGLGQITIAPQRIGNRKSIQRTTATAGRVGHR